ncbi:MAG: DUF3775 domain-containing protein [Acidobacteria bacterium]|nr:DUF3775 domain-containing protein [Acidobacteriota bacterium]
MNTLKIQKAVVDRLITLSVDHENARVGQSPGFDVQEFINYINEPALREQGQVLKSLDVEAFRDLLAIFWLGRGDYADFCTAFEHAKGFSADEARKYLRGRRLNENLSAGLVALEGQRILVD